MRLEAKIPELICQDDNFMAYDDTTKKGNLFEIEQDKFDDPV
jgi:hypothetical protein